VTFNNNTGSTKSYDYVREHVEALSVVDFVPEKTEITIQYGEGMTKTVELHDGSHLHLHKLSQGWDPTDKTSAFNKLHESRKHGEILTGLIYIDLEGRELHNILNTVKKPLNQLTERELTPSMSVLEGINAEHR
jgi:2-oxoglutarate ferredoxin oxidoreductase subunit beta